MAKISLKKKIPKKLLHLLDFAAIIVAILLLINILSPVLTPKAKLGQVGVYNDLHYNYRSEDKNSIDAFFVGNSNAYSAVSPICIWNETGIAADVSGKPFQTPKGAYKILKDMYKYQSPKVVFIDMDMFFSKCENDKSGRLKALRKEKMSAVIKRSVFGFKNRVVSSSRNAFDTVTNLNDILLSTLTNYVPLFNFHSNWDELKLSDFKKNNRVIASEYKGFVPEFGTEGYMSDYAYMAQGRKIKDPEFKGEKALKYMLDCCAENGSKVILTGIPSADTWSYKRSVMIKDIAEKYGLEYIEMNAEGAIPHFNWATDTKDSGRHLNALGAQKVSLYLADYLNSNFSFSDKRNNSSYSLWNEANDKYKSLYAQKKVPLSF